MTMIEILLSANKDLELAVENLGQAVEAIKQVLLQEQRKEQSKTGGPMIVCNFCRGAGQLRTDGKILDPCPYCGGSGNIDRNILNPTLEIQTWQLIGLEGKDLGTGVTIEVKHMDPGNKLGVLFMLEKATDLVEKGQMIRSDAQVQ